MATSASAIRTDDASLKGGLPFSLVLHGVIVALLIGGALFDHRGDSWGGPGGAITVGVVGSVPAIPMPRPEVVTENRVVDESKGLYKPEPTTPPPPPPDATPIPKFEKNQPPKYVTRPSKTLENPTKPPPNAVPYGGGGAPAVPYSSFSLGQGTTQAGMSFDGVGGGNFGERFSWYVEAVQRKVSSNWLQSTVDPRITFAPRLVATFDIARDGSVSNIQVTKSSGDASVDQSAVRAIRDSSPMDRLPPAYSGSRVSVEFWFDFKR
ncbi:MAG: TonB family protein [Candidatus Acidiferrales bacterium]|jgi:protein TonB